MNMEGAALVRLDMENRFHSCAGVAYRMRIPTGEDQLTVLTPPMLWAGMQTGTLVSPKKTIISQEKFRRAEVRFVEVPEYAQILEGDTPHGSWAVLRFAKTGLRASFNTLRYSLEQSTWDLAQSGAVEGCGKVMELAPSAVAFAEAVMSGWEPLVNMLDLIGGIDRDSWPACAAMVGDSVVEESVAAERAIRREMLQKRLVGRTSARHQRDLISTVSSLTDPKTLAALEAAIAATKAKA